MLRTIKCLLVLILTILPATMPMAVIGCKSKPTQSINVYFSPKGGCTKAIVDQIDQAKISIRIQAYSFTSKDIAKAVVEARKRGVNVLVVLDKSNEKETYSAATFLINMGVPTKIDSRHAIAHNKIILIDSKVIITGSFNFTTQAENSNAENMLVITGYPTLYEQYENNFEQHLGHSDAYRTK